MVNLPELQINTRLEIIIDDHRFSGKYLSRVMDMNERELRIMSPTQQGVPIPLHIDTPVTISYVGERAIYSFRTVIRQRYKDALAGLGVAWPKDVERVQRREYVRLEAQMQFRYRVFEGEEVGDLTPRLFKKSYIVDISGGGVKFYTEESLEKGAILEMQLGIEGLENEPVLGKVVRCRERVEGNYDIGVSFETLSVPVQDKIISWIFNKQRELRRKGLA